jgi:hypothetical protein
MRVQHPSGDWRRVRGAFWTCVTLSRPDGLVKLCAQQGPAGWSEKVPTRLSITRWGRVQLHGLENGRLTAVMTGCNVVYYSQLLETEVGNSDVVT